MTLIKNIVIWILTLESRLIIRKYHPFIVAVTGSVGKTSTKDAIYDALKDGSRFIRKSEKNLNNEFGLPLTILGMPTALRDPWGWLKNILAGLRLIIIKSDYPDSLVLEVGADHPGDIEKVARWLKPDIAVMTKISRTPVHVEFFKSPEQVFEEKAFLAEAVKLGGALVVFADEEKTASLGDRVKDKGVKVLSYGMNDKASVRVVDTKDSLQGLSFNLIVDGQQVPIRVDGLLGSGYVYSLLAAAAVGKAKDIDLNTIASSLSSFEAPKGRMNIIPGLNGSTLIDDTYNSSPDAAEAALDALKALECPTGGRKIAVLGDMMELGRYSAEEHRKIGVLAAKIAGILYTVGQRSKLSAEEALKNGMPTGSVVSFDDAGQAAEHLRSVPQAGDIILVKGSQSMRMERVSKALMAEPDKAAELLVRQELVWLEKK